MKPGFIAVLASAVFTVSFALPAGANDGNWTGGDLSGPGNEVPPDVQYQDAQKQLVADTWADYGAGLIGRSTLVAALDDYVSMFGSDLVSRELAAEPYAAATSKVLDVAQYAQNTNYYCGPASGKMIVKYLGDGDSAYNGASQTQEHMAGLDHMKTDKNGKTSWDSGLFRVGLNRWHNGRISGYYVNEDSPSVSKFKSNLKFDVDYGYPLAASTVEYAGGFHYNGHPASKTIGHWIVGHGYSGRGASAKFADPATTVWSTVNPYFWYDTSNFVNRFLQTNGHTW